MLADNPIEVPTTSIIFDLKKLIILKLQMTNSAVKKKIRSDICLQLTCQTNINITM